MEGAPYVSDIFPRPFVYCVTIRSPLARGRLAGLDCPRLPPSYALITAADIPGKNELADLPVPILAGEALSYIGEPVAILAGPERGKLLEYASQVRPLAEPEAAPPEFTSHMVKPGMALAERRFSSGDTEAAFASAKLVVSGDYKTGIQEHWYAEPVGAVALYTQEDGHVTIRTATQWPFHVKRSAASVLGLPLSDVSVEGTAVGMHMDGKIWYPSLVSCHAALAASLMKKNARLILTREEDLLYSPKRNEADVHIRSALGERGEITALEVDAELNLGAQGVFTDEALDQTCIGALGIYRADTVRLSAKAVKTNLPPQGPFSGFGLAQGFFAMERHVSRIADALHVEPGEWRKNNHVRRGESAVSGVGLREAPPVEQLLDTAAAMSDYYRKWASYELLRNRRKEKDVRERGEPLRGIGIAAGFQGNGFLHSFSDKGCYSVVLTLEKDGSLEIKTSMVTSNRNYTDIWGRIASEILAVDAGMVRIISGHTEQVPDSGPAGLSRNIAVLTRLVESACRAIRKQRFRDPLPITVRREVRPLRGKVREALEAGGGGFDRNGFSRPSGGAAVVEVEIDPVEYAPVVRGVWLGIDGGRILLEEKARTSIRVEVIQALGWASLEKLSYEEGRIERGDAGACVIPPPGKVPPI
jgi:CO/xanthine dehydrogenase Mo-binding subunit